MRRLVIVLAGLLMATHVYAAGEYLEPEDSAFTGFDFDAEYQARVISVLHEAFDRDVIIRMVGEPSFSPEYVTGIRKDKSGYVLFELTPRVQLWLYSTLQDLKNGSIQCIRTNNNDCSASEIAELERKLPKDFREVQLDRCELPIDPSLAEQVIVVWKKMLFATRYVEDPVVGVDGETFHFSMRDGFQQLAGKAWSPDPKSTTGMFIELGLAMKSVCEKKPEMSTADLQHRIDMLIQRLKEQNK